MLISVILLTLCISIATSITHVPGTIHVRVLSTNQVSNGTYPSGAVVHYQVEFDGVPLDDDVQIGVEIRGSNPSGGPRGYISMAREISDVKDFVKAAEKGFQFQLIPEEIYAGYSWFIRPFIYFANESMVSTNMMTSGASSMFTVLKGH